MGISIADREWLRPKEAAQYLGISLSTLYSWRRQGIVRFYRMGPRAVGLRRGELDAVGRPMAKRPRELSLQEFAEKTRALQERLREQYGALPDSTPFIRAERDRLSQ